MIDSDATTPSPMSFSIKDCALVALATGKKARLLQELRSELSDLESASLYHHFWGGLLQPRFEEREFNNDFAAWVKHGLHDAVLAERLAVLDPVAYPDMDALRHDIMDLIDARLDEMEYLLWARATQQFEFISSQIVVFDTGRHMTHPAELSNAISQMSTSSIFYHFIDARRRTLDKHDDFSDWLVAFGDDFSGLRQQLSGIDPFFGSLSELREQLTQLFGEYFGSEQQ